MRATLVVAILGVTGVLFTAAFSRAGGDPALKCKKAKGKAAVQKAAGLLKAMEKNSSKNPDPKLAANISKTQSKFTKAFTKAESKGGCPTNGDAGAIEAQVDAFAAALFGALAGSPTTTTTPATTTTTIEGCGDGSCGTTTTTSTTTTTAPSCGDGLVNQPAEQCDGFDDSLCPGECQLDCTCLSICGNGIIEDPEQCEPPDTETCDANCMLPSVCGDGLRGGAEQCDGNDDALCPGLCAPNCRCPECGDNAVNQPAEECDGSDDAACPARCRLDCTCVPVFSQPTCCMFSPFGMPACAWTDGTTACATGVGGSPGVPGAPGSVCDAQTGTCVAPPASTGNCCQGLCSTAVGSGSDTCCVARALDQTLCEGTFGGTFVSNTTCLAADVCGTP